MPKEKDSTDKAKVLSTPPPAHAPGHEIRTRPRPPSLLGPSDRRMSIRVPSALFDELVLQATMTVTPPSVLARRFIAAGLDRGRPAWRGEKGTATATETQGARTPSPPHQT